MLEIPSVCGSKNFADKSQYNFGNFFVIENVDALFKRPTLHRIITDLFMSIVSDSGVSFVKLPD